MKIEKKNENMPTVKSQVYYKEQIAHNETIKQIQVDKQKSYNSTQKLTIYTRIKYVYQ